MKNAQLVMVEVAVPRGFEDAARVELRALVADARSIEIDSGALRFEIPLSEVAPLLRLRTAYGAWIVERYFGRRPSVLLGDGRIAGRLQDIWRVHGAASPRIPAQRSRV